MKRGKNFGSLLIILLTLAFGFPVCAHPTQTNNQKKGDREQYREKVKQLLEQASLVRDTDPNKALTFEKEAIVIAEEHNLDRLLGQVYYYHSLSFYHLGELNKCRELLQKALVHQERHHDTINIAHSLFTLSGVLLSQDEVSLVLPYLERGIQLAEITRDKELLRMGYSKLASFYRARGEYSKALEHYSRVMELTRDTKELDKLASVHNSLGVTYYDMGNFQLALEHFNKAIDAYRRSDKLVSLSETYSNVGAAYSDMGQYKKALENYNKSLALQQQVGESGMMRVALLHNMAIVYTDLRNFGKAEKLYREALEEAEKTGMKSAQLSSLKNLAIVLSEQGRYKEAHSFQKNYSDLQDSLNNHTQARLMAEMQEKFQAERSSKEIELLKKDIELNEASISRRTWERNGSIAVLVLSLLVLLLVVRNFRQRQRAMAELNAKNEELNQQHMRELIRQQELRSVHALMEGQELERRRIAEELHDRLGSVLATVKLHYKTAVQYLALQASPAAEQLDQASVLLDQAIDEVRRISHNMASGVLRKFGLVHAIQDLREAIVATGQINMEVLVFGFKHRLDSSIEIPVYRIVQELVSNILRHARATHISVQINFFDDLLNIVVEDDGVGFDPGQLTEENNGIGLRNLKARVSQLQGTFLVDSGLGNGTTIIIDVPLLQHHTRQEQPEEEHHTEEPEAVV